MTTHSWNKIGIAALFLLAIFYVGFIHLLAADAHPECATNDSVGPCDYWGRVRLYAPLILVLPFALWPLTLIMIAYALYKAVRHVARKHTRNQH